MFDSNNMLVAALVFGLLTIIVGYIGAIVAKIVSDVPMMPRECAKWNQNHTMEWSLFFTGFMMYYVGVWLHQL